MKKKQELLKAREAFKQKADNKKVYALYEQTQSWN